MPTSRSYDSTAACSSRPPVAACSRARCPRRTCAGRRSAAGTCCPGSLRPRPGLVGAQQPAGGDAQEPVRPRHHRDLPAQLRALVLAEAVRPGDEFFQLADQLAADPGVAHGGLGVEAHDDPPQAPVPHVLLDLPDQRRVGGVPGPAPDPDRDGLAGDGQPDDDLRQVIAAVLGLAVGAEPRCPDRVCLLPVAGGLTAPVPQLLLVGLLQLEVRRGRVEEQQVYFLGPAGWRPGGRPAVPPGGGSHAASPSPGSRHHR
jgi:hypothetical protein